MKSEVNANQPIVTMENSLENVSDQRKLIALRILMNAALRLIKKRKEIKEAA